MTVDKNNISSSLPAYIYDFKETQETEKLTNNKFVTPAKLKVFYSGKTADGRVFTEEFANKLLPSLYDTPVVGYYSETDEDFIGHHATQNIYGFVPSKAEITFEKDDDGTKWAITDVLLFTGRKDNIGKIAKKIIGRKHSLELDPDSLEFDITVDGRGKVKEIVFTNAEFVGLSVVGDKQTPAFKGSAFFTTEEIKTALEDFTKYMNTNGGINMENENISLPTGAQEYIDFLSKSYNELQDEIYVRFNTWMKSDRGFWIVNMYEDRTLVVHVYNLPTYDPGYYKFAEDGDQFRLIGQVWPAYLTRDEINKLESTTSSQATEATAGTPEEQTLENSTVTTEPTPSSEATVETPVEESNIEDAISIDGSPKDGDVGNEQEVGQATAQQTGINNATLSDEERQELENYRSEEKKNVIKKFSKFLTKKEKEDFLSKLSEYTITTLNEKLSVVSMQKVLETSEKSELEPVTTSDERVPLFVDKEPAASDDLTYLINKYKDKK